MRERINKKEMEKCQHLNLYQSVLRARALSAALKMAKMQFIVPLLLFNSCG